MAGPATLKILVHCTNPLIDIHHSLTGYSMTVQTDDHSMWQYLPAQYSLSLPNVPLNPKQWTNLQTSQSHGWQAKDDNSTTQ